jgi:hypothetical protein
VTEQGKKLHVVTRAGKECRNIDGLAWEKRPACLARMDRRKTERVVISLYKGLNISMCRFLVGRARAKSSFSS